MHIQKFKKRNKTYYRLVKSGRVNGEPRIIWQKYLGTAESLHKRVGCASQVNVHSKAFGSVAAMLSIAEELEFKEIINRTVVDNNYKLSVWQHFLMQSICRFNTPASKKKSIQWYTESILPLLWRKKFSSPQTILNQFAKLFKEDKNLIQNIEEELCKVLLAKGIKPSILVWDPTNFFTYIEKGENLPRKGKSKEKRSDKNIINLGLIVSDENIPLLHTVYEGNKKEVSVITDVVDQIHGRLKKLGYGEKTKEKIDDLVIVFDRGNNSKDNVHDIEKKFNFVGSLKKDQLTELFDVPLEKFQTLYENKEENEIKGHRTRKKVFGKEYTVVVTYNEESKKKQKKKTEETVEKIKQKMKDLEEGFKKKKRGKKATLKGVASRVSDFLYNKYQALFTWDFNANEQKFSWGLNDKAFEQRKKTFGKTVLFTDLNEWTTEKIAKTYNFKEIIERDFKILKDKLLIPIKPINHTKDDHIRVHIFLCVVTLIFYRYMLWKLKTLDLNENKIVEELKNMRIAFVKHEGKNEVQVMLENMTPNQIELYSTLQMKKYLPN